MRVNSEERIVNSEERIVNSESAMAAENRRSKRHARNQNWFRYDLGRLRTHPPAPSLRKRRGGDCGDLEKYFFWKENILHNLPSSAPPLFSREGAGGEFGASVISMFISYVSFMLIFITLTSTIQAQSLSVFGIDASGFPVMKAKFCAFDAAGKQIAVRSPGDVMLREDGVERIVTKITCPAPAPPQPISSVLTIDVSGSMAGSSLQYAKAASRAWINAMPLGVSECAITSFNGRAFLNKDFTADRKELLSAIEALTADGSTDYDVALLASSAGSLRVAKSGVRAKKVIVFVSDGMPNNAPDESAIIAEAGRQNAVIYCVILGAAAPQSMKNISDKTGGQWFENVTTEAQATDIFRRMLQAAQGGKPCEFEWMSEGCGSTRSLQVSLPGYNLTDKITYEIPYESLPQIKYTPARSLHFKEVAPGTTKQLKVTLTAQGKPFHLESVKRSDDRFRIADYGGTAPPFMLDIGQSRTFTIEFAPPSGDSSYAYCLFTLNGDACLGNTFYADGGARGKISIKPTVKLLRPNGGETFVPGSDEIITWEGVMPEEKVKLEYSADNGTTWSAITDTASGLRYIWRVPETPGERCLVRVTAQARRIDTTGDMVIIPAGVFRMGDIHGHSKYTDSDEKPVHEVTITHPFLMGRKEVTQEQWKEVMGNNPSNFKGDKLPVERVSWYDAIEYCNKRSKLEGLDPCYSGSGESIVCDFTKNGYRLPTEAEWEYACRGGTETDFCSGIMTNWNGNDPVLNLIGWYDANSGSKTHEAGLKEPNTFGLFDMHGNVWEWCWDWKAEYKSGAASDPKGPSSGTPRVLRGGSWDCYAFGCRSAYRGSTYPINGYGIYGFRVSRIY